eukprot:2693476-Rhodomonas_salina.1
MIFCTSSCFFFSQNGYSLDGYEDSAHEDLCFRMLQVTDEEVGGDERVKRCVEDVSCKGVLGYADECLEGGVLRILKHLVLLPCGVVEALAVAAALRRRHPEGGGKGRERDGQPEGSGPP